MVKQVFSSVAHNYDIMNDLMSFGKLSLFMLSVHGFNSASHGQDFIVSGRTILFETLALKIMPKYIQILQRDTVRIRIFRAFWTLLEAQETSLFE